MVTTMGYYGITFSAAALPGNIYFTYMLSMIIELPAGFLAMYLVKKFGHRTIISTGLIFSGLGCLITGFVPNDPPMIRIVFSLVGKFFIICVLATNLSYTTEVFPTSTRSAVVGICSTMDKLGGIIAPFVVGIGGIVDPSLPFMIFAASNIFVGSLCLLLPETKDSSLPTTIKEAEDLQKNVPMLNYFQWFKIKFRINSKSVSFSESVR